MTFRSRAIGVIAATALLGCAVGDQTVTDGTASAAPEPELVADSLPAAAPPPDTVTIRYPRYTAADSTVPDSTGWPVRAPAPLDGSLLPARRIVAFYGNPLSKRMGILGAVPPDSMLSRLDSEVAAWERADPNTPVQPALHLVAMVAQGSAGRDGMYRALMPDSLIEEVIGWAERRDAVVFLDLQVGRSTLQRELPKIVPFLQRPNVHLGIDPEFSMKGGERPGSRIGSYDAEDVNYAVATLAELVEKHDLPPKVLVVHRFTQGMLKGAEQIRLDPRVQIVVHMDGWGPPRLKRDSYRQFVASEPVQYTGFKVFYGNDTRGGSRLMTPEEILELHPEPLYIQYQ
ncbi:lipoprotein [soil metagenome]